MSNFWIKSALTFFGSGYLRPAAGSWGSLAGLIVYIIFLSHSLILHIGVLIFLAILGFVLAAKGERIFNEKDASSIVIDEACGILISVLFLPFEPFYLIMAFFLFRLFDTIKPPPVDLVENLQGANGVMWDDLVAGVYTFLCMHTARFLITKLS